MIVLDQSVKFHCLVDAMPKAKITWMLNGKELALKDNVKFENDPKTFAQNLVISKVNASHAGKYIIIASNIIGSSEHKFEIDLLG